MSRYSAAQLIAMAAVAVACVGVFWLPWYCPSDREVPGESYVFGFNNGVAILSLAAAIAVATLARLVSAQTPSALNWFEENPRLLPPWRDAVAEYVTLGIGSVLVAGLIWAWGSSLADPGWGEAKWFLHSIDLLALGRLPYREFQFNYGPAMLYLPWGLSAATGGLVSFEQAYLVAVILFSILGFAALFLLTRSLALPGWQRGVAVGLSIAAWATITLGIQYTPLRFFVVPGVLVLLDRVVRRVGVTGLPAIAWMAIASGAAAFACLAVSPEIGIAGSAAILAYAATLVLAGRRAGAAAVAGGCAASLGAAILWLPDYFHSVGAFASGSENFPIYPSGHNLLLVAMALGILPQVIVAALRHPQDRRAALAMSVAIGGGMTLPAALGRCDPGHVFINSTVITTLVFAAAAALGKRWAIAWAAVYTLAFVVLLQGSYWGHYWHNYVVAGDLRRFYDNNPEIVAKWRDQWTQLRRDRPQAAALHWSSVQPFPWELELLAKEGPVMLVCGAERNLFLVRYLLLQKVVPPDYFHPYGLAAITPAQIDRKVQETLAARFLLIPEGVLAPLEGEIDMPAYERHVHAGLSRLLLFPMRTPARRPPFLPATVLAKRLLEHFTPIGKYQDYVVLKRKAEKSR